MPETEHILVKQVAKGSEDAVRQLYKMYDRYWFRICLRYGGSRFEADDIFQEGLLAVFKDVKQFNPEKGSFKGWSSKVFVNAALRYLKKNQWQQSFTDINLAQNYEELSEGILDQLSAKELTALIQQLPSGYRVVFNMYVLEGYKHKEIAEVLNINIGTSKSQLSKAKQILRNKIEQLFLNE